ncbi:MAG TPA: helix-turn-helix domain-containing protein [Candidatus Brocadiia bacterium]|nr:XRE family transcriptional regulator [Candidatus Brocadiales bacterium]
MTNGTESKESVIIGSQLQRARELLQLTLEEIASKLNVSPQDILGWEKERLQPNLKQLEKLAELYGREIDYFLKRTPPPPERIEFRGKHGQTLKTLSKETRIVLARFDEMCRTALEFETLLNKRLEVKLPHFKESDSPEIIAQSLRKKFNADDKPITELRTILENEGVRIFEYPVPEDVFSGFSFWHAEYGPCVLLNAEETKGRKNFTLVHEIAHLLYGHGSSLCYIPLKIEPHRDLEYKAHQVAIELLLPERGVIKDFRRRNLSKTPTQQELGKMSYKWGVSIQALGYRLENFRLIEKGYTDTLFESKPQFFRRSRTPKWEKQLGKKFVITAFEAYQKGLISTGKLAHGLRITIREAMKEIEKRSN